MCHVAVCKNKDVLQRSASAEFGGVVVRDPGILGPGIIAKAARVQSGCWKAMCLTQLKQLHFRLPSSHFIPGAFFSLCHRRHGMKCLFRPKPVIIEYTAAFFYCLNQGSDVETQKSFLPLSSPEAYAISLSCLVSGKYGTCDIEFNRLFFQCA